MKALKTLIALAATAAFGVAMAQGTPPTTASKDPATGAGQRSTQNTPMGTTGTPGGGATLQRGTTTGSGTSMGAGTTGMTSGAAPMAGSTTTTDTSAASTTSSGTGMHKAKAKKAKHRKARADRG